MMDGYELRRGFYSAGGVHYELTRRGRGPRLGPANIENLVWPGPVDASPPPTVPSAARFVRIRIHYLCTDTQPCGSDNEKCIRRSHVFQLFP